MVFRRENKADSFQRQMSALRQQLGSSADATSPDAAEIDEHQPHSRERRPATTNQAEPARGYPESSGFNFGGFSGGEAPLGGMTPADNDSAALAIPQEVDEQTSVIAHGTTWKGDLEADGSLHVHGKVEGTLKAKDTIYVADGADVDATLNADNVVIAGLVRGTVRCGARFEILPQGRVTGDILAPTFVIHEGANVTGQFRMGSPEEGEQPGPRPAAVVQRRASRG